MSKPLHIITYNFHLQGYRQVLDLIKISTLLCEIRLLKIFRQIEVRSSMFKTGMELTDVFSFLRF